MKTPEERLALLLEVGRQDVPRGSGKQRALLALDAAQANEAIVPGDPRGALTRLREPSSTSSLLLKVSGVVALSVATSVAAVSLSTSFTEGPTAFATEATPTSPVTSGDPGRFASAGGSSTVGSFVEPPPSTPTKADDAPASIALAVTPSALPPAAPSPLPSPRKAAVRAAAHPTASTEPLAAAAGAAPSATAQPDLLRDELALVDEASRALAVGRCGEAAQALDRYRARFPTGRLRDEIDVLAVELIGVRGDHAAAAARAREFLSRHPKSPYATRLSTWLSTNPGSTGPRSCVE